MNPVVLKYVRFWVAILVIFTSGGIFCTFFALKARDDRDAIEGPPHRFVANFQAMQPRCEPMLPAFCTVPHVLVDPGNRTGCASDLNTCTSEACKGSGVGPCKTLEEINRRCPQWYEQSMCVTFLGRDSVLPVGGPRAQCVSDPTIDVGHRGTP